MIGGYAREEVKQAVEDLEAIKSSIASHRPFLVAMKMEVEELNKKISALKEEKERINDGNVGFLQVMKKNSEDINKLANEKLRDADKTQAEASIKLEETRRREVASLEKLAEIDAKYEMLKDDTKKSRSMLENTRLGAELAISKANDAQRELSAREQVIKAKEEALNKRMSEVQASQDYANSTIRENEQKKSDYEEKLQRFDELSDDLSKKNEEVLAQAEMYEKKNQEMLVREIGVAQGVAEVAKEKANLREASLLHKAMVADFAVRAGRVRDAEAAIEDEKAKIEIMKKSILGGN